MNDNSETNPTKKAVAALLDQPKPVPVEIPPDIRITKCKRGPVRRTLGFDYKKPLPASCAFTKAVTFGSIKFNAADEQTVEDHLGEVHARVARKWGNESDDAKNERLARQEYYAAGKFEIGPLLQQAPRECISCRDLLPGDAKRVAILRVEQPSVGVEVTAVDLVGMYCQKCGGVPSDAENDAAEDDTWMVRLTASERQAWGLRAQGLTHNEIAERMGKRTGKPSQSTISRLLSSADRKRAAAKEEKYRQTGGV